MGNSIGLGASTQKSPVYVPDEDTLNSFGITLEEFNECLLQQNAVIDSKGRFSSSPVGCIPTTSRNAILEAQHDYWVSRDWGQR